MRYHIGLRTVKTALAVTLALGIAHLRGDSAIPIFAAIGALCVMTPRLSAAKDMAKEQALGTFFGALIGLFPLLVPIEWRIFAIGVVLLLGIPLCLTLRSPNAVTLTAIMCISIALFQTSDGSPIVYVCNRFLDTAIGLGVGFAVNYYIKPYDNYKLICKLMDDYITQFCTLVDWRILCDQHPQLIELEGTLRRIHEEVALFDAQLRTRQGKRMCQSSYVHGCLQLCDKMHIELATLCNMDFCGTPTAKNLQTLQTLGIAVPADLLEVAFQPPTTAPIAPHDMDSMVLNYHLTTLLDALGFLRELLAQESGCDRAPV